MPPKPPASTFAPTALGAALLGLSAALLAVDVGGTVMLDAPSSTPDKTSASPPVAPPPQLAARAPQPKVAARAPQTAALPPVAVAQPAAAPVSLVSHVVVSHAVVSDHVASHVAVTLAAASLTAVAPERRPTAPAMERPALAQRQTRTAQAITTTAPAIRTAAPAIRTTAATAHIARPAVVALAQPARARPVVNVTVRPKHEVARIASLSDVRHFAMRRLTTSYPNVSVISADTYSLGGDTVRVSMVVQNGAQRWVEKDVVKRSGTSLALEKSARHGMPYASASTPEPLTVAEPDGGP